VCAAAKPPHTLEKLLSDRSLINTSHDEQKPAAIFAAGFSFN